MMGRCERPRRVVHRATFGQSGSGQRTATLKRESALGMLSSSVLCRDDVYRLEIPEYVSVASVSKIVSQRSNRSVRQHDIPERRATRRLYHCR